jgi:hypothetical protein
MSFSSIFQLVANVLIHLNCLFVEMESVMSWLVALVLDLEAYIFAYESSLLGG